MKLHQIIFLLQIHAAQRVADHSERVKRNDQDHYQLPQEVSVPMSRKRAEYGWASTVSNTELNELFGPHRVLGRELGEFFSTYYLCAKSELTECFC